jgi:hypothetical protein
MRLAGAVVLLTGKGAELTESGANIATIPRDTASPIAVDLLITEPLDE